MKARRRTVEVHWVPAINAHGRPVMEMRWLVEDHPPVGSEA